MLLVAVHIAAVLAQQSTHRINAVCRHHSYLNFKTLYLIDSDFTAPTVLRGCHLKLGLRNCSSQFEQNSVKGVNCVSTAKMQIAN